MTETDGSRRGAALAVLVLLAASALPLFAGARASRLLGDDAFITLTVARALARGQGFTYHGVHVLCTTTPLLAMLIGAAGRLRPGADLASTAIWLGSVAWLATGWVVLAGRKALGLGLWPGLVVALMVVAGGWTSSLGMEAHLFTFLLTLSVVLAFGRRPLAAGLAVGLCTLTRGEGALLLPVLVMAVYVSERRLGSPATLVAGWSLVTAPWAVYAYRAFGSPLPHTLAAKTAQAASGHWSLFVPSLFHRWLPLWAAPWGPGGPALATPLWWLVGLGVGSVLLCDRRLLPFLAWAGAYVAAYAVLGVPDYPWYVLPVLFVLQLTAALGAARLARLPLAPVARLTLSSVAVVYLVGVAVVGRVNEVRRDAGDPRGPAYLALASWLRSNVPPSSSVAFLEVGYLGFFTENPIVDLAGLVTPDVVTDVRAGDFATGFYRAQPDTFVYLPDFDWALGKIVSQPRFDELYCPAARLAGPYERPFTIYRRCVTTKSPAGSTSR